MKKCLSDLLGLISSIEKSNGRYYKLNDFFDILDKMTEDEIEVEDTIITPFYICDLGVLELYDYEFNIRLVNSSNVDNFILVKTGKKNLGEVSAEIEEKLRKCYVELVIPQKFLSIFRLQEFIGYVKDSLEIKERIRDTVHEFNGDKLYFEVY